MEIGLGHFSSNKCHSIYVNSDRMVTLWIGIWNWFTIIWGNAYVLEFDNATSMYWIWHWIIFADISGHTYVQKFWRCYIHVLDLELDWVISEVMQMLEYGTSMHMLEYCTSMYCHILVTFRKLKYLDLCSNTYHQRGWVWGFGLIQYTILDLTMGKFRAQGVHHFVL